MSNVTEKIIWRPSPNFDARDAGVPIDMLVMHYTGMQTAEAALDRLTDESAKVSAHYFIDEDGQIYSLVQEEMRAWHAGVSCWRGHRNVNARSIGIEIVNPGHEFGYCAFPDNQMEAVLALSGNLVARHAIPPRNVVGHSDVAPDRKEDPGELFDWQGLAEEGIGLWYRETDLEPHALGILQPGMSGSGVFRLQEALRAIGYGLTPDENYGAGLVCVVRAFQRHWRPSRVDGIADQETQSIVYALLKEVRRLT
jgi:N-acetylmuramoyl-L-alanine amidase